MSLLSSWFPSFWEVLGWTMLHFLWVGALIALFARLVLWAARRRSPRVRYAVALAGFLFLALAPAVLCAWRMADPAPLAAITEGIEIPRHAGEPIVDEAASFRQSSVANSQQEKAADAKLAQRTRPLGHAASVTAFSARKADASSPSFRLWIGYDVQKAVGQSYGFALRMLPWLWVCGFPLACVWIVLGVTGTERLRRACRPLDNEEWLSLCRRLEQQLRIRIRVRFAVSDGLRVPLLIGIVRPLVLLPASALSGYSPEHVEMIVLHELAHVRRWDNLVNLLQRLVEAVLFFHPSVWWLSRRVRLEREHCCDAVVLAYTGAPQRYAEFLAHLALPGIIPQRALSVSAGEQLVARIRHILNQEKESMKVSRTSVIGASAFFVALIAVAIAWAHLKAAAAPVAIEATGRIPRFDREGSTTPQQAHAAHDVSSGTSLAQATTPSAVEALRGSSTASPHADKKADASQPAPKYLGMHVGMALSGGSRAATSAEQDKAELKFAGQAFWQWETVLMTELDPKMRVEALDALGRFGAFGYEKEASAAIAKFLSKGRLIRSDQGDQKVEEAAQAAFSRIGPPALKTALELLKDKSPEVRRLATEIVSALLRDVAEPKPSTLEALAEATNDRDEHVRLAALQALSQTFGRTKGVYRDLLAPVVVKKLQDDSPGIRLEAAAFLGDLGPSAAGVVPALLAALKDPRNEKTRVRGYYILRTVIDALRRCGTSPGVLVPALIELLPKAQADFGTLQSITLALGNLESQAAPAVPALIEALKRSDRTEYQWAGGVPPSQQQHEAVGMIAKALGQIGPTPENQAARTVLKEKLSKLRRSDNENNDPSIGEAIRAIQHVLGPPNPRDYLKERK
jgi:beta-lactamase regulating signal transducer with metallopeptidase domain/HEAT repeat protein